MRKRKWRDDKGGKGEHPLVYRKYRISLYQLVEHRQIKRKRQLGKHTQEVTSQVAYLRVVCRGTRENKQQGTTETHKDTTRLLTRYRLLQYQSREKHGEYRHRCGHNA